MKAALVILILLALVIVYVMFSGSAPPPRQAAEEAPRRAPTAETTRASQPQPTAKEQKGAVESVMDYGTGYTQMQVKKRSSSKLDDITGKRNREIEAGSR